MRRCAQHRDITDAALQPDRSYTRVMISSIRQILDHEIILRMPRGQLGDESRRALAFDGERRAVTLLLDKRVGKAVSAPASVQTRR